MLDAPRRHLPEPFRVVASSRETADTWTLELEPENGEALSFIPGQFTMLYAYGVGEIPISISGDPSSPDRLVHTIRAVGAVSEALCHAKVGSAVGVRGPFGRGWPVEEVAGREVVIVAGGVGLAPLRSLILTALGRGEGAGRTTILYGGRDPESLLYARELERWAGDAAVDIIVDVAKPGWRGRVGVVTKLIAEAAIDPGESVAMVCGPEIMMRLSVNALIERGMSPERVSLSMERNMRCAVGRCGHCQWGADFVCRDGPVFRWSEAERRLGIREL